MKGKRKDGKIMVGCYVDVKTRKEFKIQAAKWGETMSSILEKKIKEFVAKS